MEYRGEDYYYFIYNAKTQQYINPTFDGNMPCKIKNASG
jgi:hypothetical protein